MVLIVIYYKNKINVIIYAASIVSMMTSESQRWTRRLFRAAAASGFEETVKVLDKKSSFSENQVFQDPGGSVQLVIFIIALGATLDQPFFTFLRLHGEQANYYRSVYACACFIDPVGYPCAIGGI